METSVSYLQVLECTACGGEFDADTVHGVCPSCGKVLFARYDLAAVRSSITPDDFLGRSWDMWRYRELLPVRNSANVVTLGEGMTPLLRVSEHVSARLGFTGGRPPVSGRTSRSRAMSRRSTSWRCGWPAATSFLSTA